MTGMTTTHQRDDLPRESIAALLLLRGVRTARRLAPPWPRTHGAGARAVHHDPSDTVEDRRADPRKRALNPHRVSCRSPRGVASRPLHQRTPRETRAQTRCWCRCRPITPLSRPKQSPFSPTTNLDPSRAPRLADLTHW